MKLKSNVVLCGLTAIFLLFVHGENNIGLPQTWLKAWSLPPADYRPLQIVHGADIRTKASYYKDSCGLGGVVCNVPFGEKYLKSEEDWKVYVDGVKAMHNSGLRVWIYDEDGYPSLGAGGRVLEADPSLEALEMVYDSKSRNPIFVRRCYEFTHACNNFYVARRYPNPLNPKATEKFIHLTHQSYLVHLGSELFGEVEAFFTDEPSMMAVNLGELREDVRKNVKVTDPLDPDKKNLPMVSWAADLPEKYKAKYGKELMPSVASLFSGKEEADKVTRQSFWSLLAELDKKYYYDAIRDWNKFVREKSGGKGPVSSGHGLREEDPANHVALDGNKLLVSSGFDIPGLDQLSSDPTIWGGSSWMAVFFPNSSAVLNGQRRVMCEMSDFEQTLNGKGPSSLENMEAATAWQMAFGVTDFNLYYSITYGTQYPNRREPAYKEYCNFVGRVNSVVKEATPVINVLLYYPIYDLQREYIPTAEKMSVRTQSELTRTLESSFRDLGANLLKTQIQFVLVDYLNLERAVISDHGTIQIGKNQYSSIVFPKGVVFTASMSNLLDQARTKGVKVILGKDFNETPSPDQLAALLDSDTKIYPANSSVAFGEFVRDGKQIFMFVNTGKEGYKGALNAQIGKRYVELNPQTGAVSDPRNFAGEKIEIQLSPLQTKIVVVL